MQYDHDLSVIKMANDSLILTPLLYRYQTLVRLKTADWYYGITHQLFMQPVI